MISNARLYESIAANNNMITTAQAMALGYSKTSLSSYTRRGLLKRVHHGIYTLPDAIYDDMYVLSICSEKIVFSHETALFLNGLSDRTPFSHSVTIPSNAALPASIKNDCVCYYIKPELHDVGVTTRKTTFGNIVKCYDAERTVCDMLRSRSRLDEESVIAAVKNYAASREKDLSKLGQYSKLLRVSKDLKKYMEVLL